MLENVLISLFYMLLSSFTKTTYWRDCLFPIVNSFLFCHGLIHNGEEGNGTPRQYSCLENPMAGGAWWAAVHGVDKSWTLLSDFTFTFHLHALEKEMETHSRVLAWRIPGMGEPGGLLSMGSHRVGHDWSDLAAAAATHDGVITHLEDILECEVKWALGSITTNKASGGDGIPVELFQILKDDAVKVLRSIYQQIWKTQQWPQDWKRSVFIPIPKKGNAKECSDYYTIALISHASKVMLKILQARLQQFVNQELPDVHAGFRKGRGTRDQIANIGWIIEKAREFHKNPCFMD